MKKKKILKRFKAVNLESLPLFSRRAAAALKTCHLLIKPLNTSPGDAFAFSLTRSAAASSSLSALIVLKPSLK